MATIQSEKFTLGIVESNGTPKTGALVELKIGASTYVMVELGTGKYQIASIPTGKYFVWIDSVSSGESVSVGSGQIPALGNEADVFLIGEANDWKIGTPTEVKTLLSLENVTNVAIPDPTGNNGKVLSVSGDAYQLASFSDVSDKLDKVDPTAQSVVSEVTFQDTITLTTTAPETPIKTLGRNASNEVIEFDNVVGGGQVDSVVGGTNVTIDNTDSINPIINVSAGGQVDLQDAYDNGELITTDATNGAVTLKRGSALDTDNVLEIQNGAGTTNASVTGEGNATFGGIVNASRGYFQDSNNNNFPIRAIEAPNAVSTNIFMQGDGELGILGVRADSSRRFNFRSETTTDSNFLLRLYDSAGLNSKVMFLTDYATNTFETLATFKAIDKILQGGVTDSGEGIQGASLGIRGDVNFIGINTEVPTLALGLNASHKVITYAVPSQSPRVTSVASTTTLTIDVTTTDQSVITAQSNALTIAIPTGSPADGVKQVMRIKDNGTARVLTFNAIFRTIGITLPVNTTANKTLYIACIYNAIDAKWDVVAVSEEA